MRIAPGRRVGPSQFEEGTVVDGYEVESVGEDHVGPELRYLVRTPDGERATLVTARRPATERRERARIRRLAARRMSVSHPAVLAVYAAGEHGGHPYLITEAYPARTLGDVLDDEAPLAPERVFALLAPVADALDSAHEAGLVHQAFEADSLLVDDSGRLALDSFGVLVGGEGFGWTGAQSADVRHRPPEQALGESPGPRSNVYSLAAMMFHALTGAPPFGDDRTVATYAHAMEPPPRVTDRVAGLPRSIDDVVAWGMAKQPEARPGSALELLRAAETALGVHTGGDAAGEVAAPRVPRFTRTAPLTPPPRTPPAPSRGRVAGAIAAVVALAAACGAIAAVALDPFGDDSPPAPPPSAEAQAWQRLADQRPELRDELAAAATPDEQAVAATELARLYDGAADSARPSRRTGAARSAAAAYLALADAARAGDEPAFVYASAAIDAAERRVASARR